jgi:hypothetical protein
MGDTVYRVPFGTWEQLCPYEEDSVELALESKLAS